MAQVAKKNFSIYTDL